MAEEVYPGSPSGDDAPGSVCVQVSFDLRSYAGSGFGMDDGPDGWGYNLVRVNRAWRIEGVG